MRKQIPWLVFTGPDGKESAMLVELSQDELELVCEAVKSEYRRSAGRLGAARLRRRDGLSNTPDMDVRHAAGERDAWKALASKLDPLCVGVLHFTEGSEE